MSQFTTNNLNDEPSSRVTVATNTARAPKQRIIVPEDIIPVEERTTTAWNEIAIGDHLDRFLQAEDNAKKTFVFSALFGGCHLYCYAPSKSLRRDYWTIVTMGLSGTKMNVPEGIEGAENYSRCEVSLKKFSSLIIFHE